MPPKRSIILKKGDKRNYLNFLNERDEISKHTGFKIRVAICECDCGKIVETTLSGFLAGKPKSCGCKRKGYKIEKTHPVHGMSKTRIYSEWKSIKRRCSPGNKYAHKYYADRGIAICEEWENNFMAFYKWAMENGYTDELTLDRQDNNKGYSPDNCRWTNRIVQANNTRSNIFFEYNGKINTLAEICINEKVNYMTIWHRIKRGGLSLEDAIKRGNVDFSKIQRK